MAEWLQIPAGLPHVLKLGNCKFYRCPVAVITPETWALLDLVNESIDSDGNITIPPVTGGLDRQTYLYREAVKIVRSERSAWRKEQMEAARGK